MTNHDGWDEALESFTRKRAPQAGRVQRTARTWGNITHADGLERVFRDELLARRDPDDFRYIDWLYGDHAD
ncbi:hypothetical protein [Glaciibacter superstes]|uniref:hypothetical protein n=1 Tax=Glaciibacter superstes TaxID=501023 RepID=UPI0012F83F9E|nr:hypothetical protein [Glaciibacter superstes]